MGQTKETRVDRTEEIVLPLKNKRSFKKKIAEGSSQEGENQKPHNDEIGDQPKNGDGMTLIKEHGEKPGN